MTTIDISDAAAFDGAPQAASRRPATRAQFLARLTGILFLITFIASIPPVVWFYAPALGDPSYITGAGPEGGLRWGAVLELVLILANIGTAVALFPVLKRQSEALSLGYVAARLTECGFIAVGILSLLAIGTLRLHHDGADPATLTAIGQALVALHDWTFRLGPGVVVGIGNGVILGWLMWRSRLVPRALSILGLIGGPLILISGLAVVLAIIPAGQMAQGVATIPEFFWELGLGLWLTIRGFDNKALKALPAA